MPRGPLSQLLGLQVPELTYLNSCYIIHSPLLDVLFRCLRKDVLLRETNFPTGSCWRKHDAGPALLSYHGKSFEDQRVASTTIVRQSCDFQCTQLGQTGLSDRFQLSQPEDPL